MPPQTEMLGQMFGLCHPGHAASALTRHARVHMLFEMTACPPQTEMSGQMIGLCHPGHASSAMLVSYHSDTTERLTGPRQAHRHAHRIMVQLCSEVEGCTLLDWNHQETSAGRPGGSPASDVSLDMTRSYQDLKASSCHLSTLLSANKAANAGTCQNCWLNSAIFSACTAPRGEHHEAHGPELCNLNWRGMLIVTYAKQGSNMPAFAITQGKQTAVQPVPLQRQRCWFDGCSILLKACQPCSSSPSFYS